MVVIDAKSGKRWPIWVEIDSNADTPEETSVLIHPAKNFAAGRRYIVAMRDLKTATGATIPAPEGFTYYRDDLDSTEPAINTRRGHFERIFKSLAKAKVKRGNLYLAWDFTVASDRNIAERMLHIRDDAFKELGDRKLGDLKVKGGSPSFAVDEVTELAPCGADGCQDGEDPNVAREIRGSFTVPCYMEPDCDAGGRFVLNAKGLPSQNGTWTANFNCIVPRSAADAEGIATANRPAVYGHGLLGSADEALSSAQRTLAVAHGFVFCATDEIGFSENDIPNIIGILQDLSTFPELTDRVQQGLLNELYLGRLMIHKRGFASNAAFRANSADAASPSVLNRSRLYYNGNSQGGILGGALTAVAPDFTRASLGVPAMNYSVLLQRSVDFDLYSTILDPNYPSALTQALSLSLIQMLWDRSDPNGYAHRMTVEPAARHAQARGADERRLRRPPGDHLAGRGRGADDRRQDPRAGRLRRPLAGRQGALGDPADRQVPVPGIGADLLGHGSDPARPREPGRRDRHRSATDREPAQPHRRRPTRRAARGGGRAEDGLRLPAQEPQVEDSRHL